MWSAITNIARSAFPAVRDFLLGTGATMASAYLGNKATGLVDTIGNTGSQTIDNLGQMGAKKIGQYFGSTGSEFASVVGGNVSSAIVNQIKSRACEAERARILELEDELAKLKRVHLDLGE